MSSPSREGGYSLVLLIIAITVLNIAVAAALPLWSTAIQREREEELVFRGMQYAEAIRVFRQRQGRLPNTLQELIKVQPRCIRQLWTDPMTDETEWGLVRTTPTGRNVRGRDLRNPQHPGIVQAVPADQAKGTNLGPDGKPARLRGPIRGVFSRSTDPSIRLFFNRSTYNEWKFSVDLFNASGRRPAGQSGEQAQRRGPGQRRGQAQRRGPGQRRDQGQKGGQGLRLSIRDLGRPLPGGVGAGMAPGGGGLGPSTLKTTDPSGRTASDARQPGRRNPG